MTKSARMFTLALVTAVTLFNSTPALAEKGGDVPQMLWLAASGAEPGVGTNWGRLTLKDGILMFRSSSSEWQLAVSDIKRAAVSPQSDDLIVVESVDGETYYVTILGPNMLVESPRKALQVIRKAAGAAVPGARRER
jgi:hypothetical protein